MNGHIRPESSVTFVRNQWSRARGILNWRASPLKRFKAVPKDGKPISEWSNQNNAFLDVVTELRRLATSEPNPTDSSNPPVIPTKQSKLTPKYRLKRSFDEIDRVDFRRKTYDVIREYFETNVAEINQVEGIRARNEDIGALAFTCIVLNRLIRTQEGQAAITIRATPSGSSYGALGDVYYSNKAHAPENVANGGFRVEADDYELFLKRTSFEYPDRDRKWTPDEAAHRLWEELLKQAGISYGQ